MFVYTYIWLLKTVKKVSNLMNFGIVLYFYIKKLESGWRFLQLIENKKIWNTNSILKM